MGVALGWYILVLFGGLLQICINAFPVYRDRRHCCVGVSRKMNKTPLHKEYARDFGVGKGQKMGNRLRKVPETVPALHSPHFSRLQKTLSRRCVSWRG